MWGNVAVCFQVNTLVFAEHEEGLVKQSSISAIEAAGFINKENSVSVLLAGKGPNLLKAASHAASSHPLVSEVTNPYEYTLYKSFSEILFRLMLCIHYPTCIMSGLL